MGGLVVSALGLIFGLIIFTRLKNMAVHSSMREVSELIYETCKTYLATQGKFLMLLECFIAVIIVFYFGFLKGSRRSIKSLIILLFSVIGIYRQFRRGGLRHARQYLRQFAHRLRRSAGQGLSRAMTSRCRPA